MLTKLIVITLVLNGCVTARSSIGDYIRPSVANTPSVHQPCGSKGAILTAFMATTTEVAPHFGVDFKSSRSKSIIAVFEGRVVGIANSESIDPNNTGGVVEISHNILLDGHTTLGLFVYAHLDLINVKVGDHVTRGQVIGTMWRPDAGQFFWIEHVHISFAVGGLRSVEKLNPLLVLGGCISCAPSDATIFPVVC